MTLPMLAADQGLDSSSIVVIVAALPVTLLVAGSPDACSACVAVVTRLTNRVVLAFLGGSVGVVSVGLIAIEGGPELAGDTSLFRFFGYFGLFCATVLVMRVLVGVLRDDSN